MFEPDNHGLYWNGKDLRRLHSLYVMGTPLKEIAKILCRTESACSARVTIIRTAMVFYRGSDDQTVKNFTLRDKDEKVND